MKRSFKVRQELAIAGDKRIKRGTVISDADLPEGTNIEALIEGQFLSVQDVEPAPCPRCAEEGMKRPPKFETIEELHEHYAEKHAGLVPPSEEDLDDARNG